MSFRSDFEDEMVDSLEELGEEATLTIGSKTYDITVIPTAGTQGTDNDGKRLVEKNDYNFRFIKPKGTAIKALQIINWNGKAWVIDGIVTSYGNLVRVLATYKEIEKVGRELRDK